MVYHHLTLKKCCKCLMFKMILPDNVPRASFIYVRRLQLRMNINEHPLIRNTTLFCLNNTYIWINCTNFPILCVQLRDFLRFITPIQWRLTSSTGRWNFALLDDACHIFEAYVFTMTLAFFFRLEALFDWKTYQIFLI